MSAQMVITAQILIQAPSEAALDNVSRYAISAIKQSCRGVRGGAVVIGMTDQNGKFLGLNLDGTLSKEMREVMGDLFGTDIQPD